MAEQKFDRSKFKATKVVTMNEEVENVKKIVGYESNFTDVHKIEKGLNLFRIYPAHPGSNSFAQAVCLSWVPGIVERKNDKGVVEKKEGNVAIYNSRIHFSADSTDVVEAYCKMAMKLAEEEIEDKALRKAKLAPLFTYGTKLFPQTSWVMYADKVAGKVFTFGRLKVTDGSKKQLNSLAIGLDEDGKPIETDPFTDPDSGKGLLINNDPDAKDKGDTYKLSVDFNRSFKLTDEQLEHFMTVDPLEKIYTNCYTYSDFEKAVIGLQMYDTKHKLGVFQCDEWKDLLQEIASQYPKEGAVAEEEIEEDEVEKDTDPYDLMNRQELKVFLKQNQIPFVVLTKHSEDDLRKAIREEMKNREDNVVEEEVEDDLPEVEEDNTGAEDLPWINEAKNQVAKDAAKDVKKGITPPVTKKEELKKEINEKAPAAKAKLEAFKNRLKKG